MKNAVETIINIIANKVKVANLCATADDQPEEKVKEVVNRLSHELTGMLICLKNINDDDRHYCISRDPYCSNHLEFGYYDSEGKWVKIAE